MRVLLVADTHLGLDDPVRPRVERRRRGPDFFANFDRALEPARRGEVDLVVHGGDLLFRSKVRPSLVARALAPLIEIAERDLPVVLVAGNHERSALPYPLLAAHPGLHVLEQPRTINLEVHGRVVSVAGFGCIRNGSRDVFAAALETTGWRQTPAAIRLLCLHQTVEGARVGPAHFCFRGGPDVVRGRDIPTGFAAVLAGHIHRHQVLTRDLRGQRLAAPVLYPGAVERTSFAERAEPKGFVTAELDPDPSAGGRLRSWRFHRLPTRPLEDIVVNVSNRTAEELTREITESLFGLDRDAVVRLRMVGTPRPEARSAVSAPAVRALAPPSMTVETRWG